MFFPMEPKLKINCVPDIIIVFFRSTISKRFGSRHSNKTKFRIFCLSSFLLWNKGRHHEGFHKYYRFRLKWKGKSFSSAFQELRFPIFFCWWLFAQWQQQPFSFFQKCFILFSFSLYSFSTPQQLLSHSFLISRNFAFTSFVRGSEKEKETAVATPPPPKEL